MDKQDSLWIGLTELPPCLGVLEEGPEWPAVGLGQRVPAGGQKLGEPPRNATIGHRILISRDRRSDSSWGLVDALVPSVVGLLVVVLHGHEGVQSVAADIDVLALWVEIGFQSVEREVGLQKATVFLRLDHRLDHLCRWKADVDPGRDHAYRARLLLAPEHQLRHDGLHPSRAALPPSSDDDVTRAVIHHLPLRSIEVVSLVLVGDGRHQNARDARLLAGRRGGQEVGEQLLHQKGA
mmetsp:Transcript_87816/g.183567  ORF Transcript_87816/g.183567 Transcript_87816/m.183567 type:complete len:237 (+) Transcript_87816:480-1190(+)